MAEQGLLVAFQPKEENSKIAAGQLHETHNMKRIYRWLVTLKSASSIPSYPNLFVQFKFVDLYILS